MFYNYWIKTEFEETGSYGLHSRPKKIIQLSRVDTGFKSNHEKTIHDGKNLNLWIEITGEYKGNEKIREMLYSDIFETDKKYRVKKEIKKELHSPLLK